MRATRVRLALLAALAAAAAGCGQQGPLVLPPDARPIERVDPPPAPDAPNDDDDERRRER
jgi:predicted small lipoprotein YifL